ncbi:hypothetical protein [Candidatus Symbiopectobacterium sp. 'North America']|nr:hypothetical protein [Candidatus Symbiopectobacterium sp. 'North America']
MYSVTIDTGTTNTRVFVWQDNRIIAEPARRLACATQPSLAAKKP